MARLNEPSAPIESVESLKRRFIRQNRELARVNSAQSIRIRSLEGDLTRLLGENAGLQNRIIKLEKDMAEGVSRQAAKNIDAIKSKLDAKIQDLAELTHELNQFSRQHRHRSSPGPQDSSCSTNKSPSQRQWKNTSSLHDILAAQEALLPTIAEDKLFPRRTLDANDFGNLFTDNFEGSPDLGPPPKASFESEDDATLGATPGLYDEEKSVAGPLANLETRRRRRDRRSIENATQLKEDRLYSSELENTDNVHGGDPVKQVPRTGLKRKFNVNNANPPGHVSATPNTTTSTFRKAHGAVFAPGAAKIGTSENATMDPVLSSPNRKALVPKHGNMGLPSPQKPQKECEKLFSGFDAVQPPVKSVNNNTKRDRKTKPKVIRIPPSSNQIPDSIELDIEPIKIEPKTPAPLDLFSPQSSKPSETRQELKDTPPPADLRTNERGEGSEGAGRHSRRARAIVSYAEPSLVSKMRRPTKELADAVSREHRRSSATPLQPSMTVVKPEGNISALLTGQLAIESMETEACAHQLGLTEPESPLGDRSEQLSEYKPEQDDKTSRRVSGMQHRPSAKVSKMPNLADFGNLDNAPIKQLPADEVPSISALRISDTLVSTKQSDPTCRPQCQTEDLTPKAGLLPSTRPASSRRQSMGARMTATETTSKTSQPRAGQPLDSGTASSSRLAHARSTSAVSRLGAKVEASSADNGTSDQAERSKNLEEARARGERIAARRRSMAL